MKICNPLKCTGCGMCADACPRGCISINYDAQGFYKSHIDESRCVNCNHCMDVCPANNPNKQHHIQKAYKARRTDAQATIYSASGGIASVLSEYIIRNGGVVAGCGYDNVFRLKHSLASTIEELESFKGSKYLQSYTVGIYKQVREKLHEGEFVLFIGTPCQVSALQNFLGNTYNNLYTIDFVCHGVPSQYVFDKYLDYLNPIDKPLSIRFRNKTHGYRNKKACFEIQVDYLDRTMRNTTESGVYYWFASSLSVRESCYNCPFVSAGRASDITLADYKGNDIDNVDNDVGVNAVFINSDKGETLFDSVKQDIKIEQRSVGHTIKLYDRLMIGSNKPICRNAFFDDLFAYDYETLVKKYDVKRVLPSKMVRRYYAMKRRLFKLFVRDK